MPRTQLTEGTYVEFEARYHRITKLYYPKDDPLTQHACLEEIAIDEDGKVAQTGQLISNVPVHELQNIGYPIVVLQLAIYDRHQERDALSRQIIELSDEIASLALAINILQRNYAINGDRED